jgi:hypothetical protein
MSINILKKFERKVNKTCKLDRPFISRCEEQFFLHDKIFNGILPFAKEVVRTAALKDKISSKNQLISSLNQLIFYNKMLQNKNASKSSNRNHLLRGMSIWATQRFQPSTLYISPSVTTRFMTKLNEWNLFWRCCR